MFLTSSPDWELWHFLQCIETDSSLGLTVERRPTEGKGIAMCLPHEAAKNSTTALSITKSGGMHMESSEYNAPILMERFLNSVRDLVEKGKRDQFLGSFMH